MNHPATLKTLFQTLAQARARKEASEYSQALELYRAVLDDAPPDFAGVATAYVEMGLVLGFMGEFEASLDTLQEATRRWPGNAQAQLSLGKTLLMLSCYAEARAPLERTIALATAGDPVWKEAQVQLGYLKQFGF